MANIAIVWDLENVTPPSNNSLFVDALWDYAESLGRVVNARAYADWSEKSFAKLAFHLKKYHFTLVHVPTDRKGKNSVDIQMVTDTLELLRFYPDIDAYLLVTGDSDFRPLLLALRKAGKINHVVCDTKTASRELLSIADEFTDYREVLSTNTEEEPTGGVKDEKLPKEFWFAALAEAVQTMINEKRPTNLGNVKVQLRVLNPQFDEASLGFKRWSDFVSAAAEAGYVEFMEDAQQSSYLVPGKNNSAKEKGLLQRALKTLVEVLKDLDGGKEPKMHSYALVSNKIKDRGVDIKQLGFSQFKKFIQAADVRGLVASKTEGIQNYVQRI
jgi:hypothetical protein